MCGRMHALQFDLYEARTGRLTAWSRQRPHFPNAVGLALPLSVGLSVYLSVFTISAFSFVCCRASLNVRAARSCCGGATTRCTPSSTPSVPSACCCRAMPSSVWSTWRAGPRRPRPRRATSSSSARLQRGLPSFLRWSRALASRACGHQPGRDAARQGAPLGGCRGVGTALALTPPCVRSAQSACVYNA